MGKDIKKKKNILKGKNIADVLDMTVENALEFLQTFHLLEKAWKLSMMYLGYMRLGQPAPTLSGGEAQS